MQRNRYTIPQKNTWKYEQGQASQKGNNQPQVAIIKHYKLTHWQTNMTAIIIIIIEYWHELKKRHEINEGHGKTWLVLLYLVVFFPILFVNSCYIWGDINKF